MDVSDIMSRKLVCVGLDDRVNKVRELFLTYRFHHLLVIERKKLHGVISDRDLLKNLSPFIGKELAERAQDIALLDRHVHQIMTRKPVTVQPETALENAVQVMLSHGVSCLPVINEHGHALGIVTWKDLFRALVPGVEIPPVRWDEVSEQNPPAADHQTSAGSAHEASPAS